ncbi:MAG: extracellular solute-binding protein [Saccharofermentanales bacterium]
MKKFCLSLFVLGLIVYLQITPLLSTVCAESAAEDASTGNAPFASFNDETYRNYLKTHGSTLFPENEIILEAASYRAASESAQLAVADEFSGERNVLLWNALGGTVEWNLELPEDALYLVEVQYYVLSKESRNVELGFLIDDIYPFSSAANIVLPRTFTGNDEIVVDQRGNDIRPSYAGFGRWQKSSLKDNSGLYNTPYAFFFSKGQHTIKFEGVRAGVALKSIRLYSPSQLPSYTEYSNDAAAQKMTDTIFIEGENPKYVSDSILYPVYDRTGPDTSPSDPVKLKLNTIGQGNWSMHGQSVTWNIDVEKAGYYQIGVRFQQNLMRNVTSYRRLYINGAVPFQEADALAFGFSDKWQTKKIGGGWLFYFKEGVNEITLEAVPGPVGGIIAELENTIFEMNTIYRKIIMITGVNADPNRDYQLEKEIPGLMDGFESVRNSCLSAIDALTAQSGRNTAATTSALNRIVIQCESFLEKPETIAIRISRLRDNISSLSALIISLKNQPLEIDYLSVGTDDAMFHPAATLLDRAGFSIKAFFGSFFEDYMSIGVRYAGENPLNVWVNMGRDQTQVIKTMTDSIFTPESDIPVNISLVQQSLIQATLSNKGPDVVIFVNQNDPVNLAARNALVDLTQFETYQDVIGRFNENAIIPYRFDGGAYAIPVTEDFMMMYYRKDVFAELELEPPKTWDEFYKVLSVLQRNNMSAGIPNMPPDSQMSTNNGIFAMLIKQMGGSYFKDDLSKTEFDSAVSVEAFKKWTGFYSKYGLPYQFDFFNRFRTGEMPVGLDSYTMFNKLAIGAPEIKGLWEMVPIPGTPDGSGTINNQSFAAGSGIIMLKNADDYVAGWKFIDWFTSDPVQADFGLQMESLLGASGRYNTANLAAFKKLPWSAKEQMLISRQWEKIFELPQVPGGYFIDRNLTNAFRQVVFLNKNPREVLLDYNKEINLEIKRKRIEFGLD